MASAGGGEGLCGGSRPGSADGGGGLPPVGPEDDDEEVPRKKRVKTSTKILLVVAGWVLLTLFLVGQFSKDKGNPQAVARLDTVANGDGSSAEPEKVDTEEEA